MNRRVKQLAVIVAVAMLPIMAMAGSQGIPKVLDMTHRAIEGGETITFFVTGGAMPEIERHPEQNSLLVKFPGAVPGPAVTHYKFNESGLIKGLSSRIEAVDGAQEFIMSVDLKKMVPCSIEDAGNGRIVLHLIGKGDTETAAAEPAAEERFPALGSDEDVAAAGNGDAAPAADTPYRFWTPDADVPIPEYKAIEAQQRIMEDRIFNQMITLELKDAPMQDVIRLIARRANLNIIMNQNQVQGTVTVKLENVPLGTALDAILKTNDLAYVREEGGIVRIVPRSEVRGTREAVETQTVNIPINWLPADNVAATLRPFLSEGRIQANKESNSIIVTDVPPKVAEIRQLIAEIDIPEKQVMIEARLIDMSEQAQRSLGIRWSMYKPDTSGVAGMPTSSSASPLGAVRNAIAGEGMDELAGPITEGIETNLTNYTGRGALMTLGADLHVFGNDYNFEAQIDALESRNLVKTLANPKVVTLNNVPATIEIKKNIPYTEAVQGPSGDTTTQEVEFEEAGILLEVLPNITNNGYVRMMLKPEQKIDRGRFQGIPIIDERALEANVIVKDESTVVLGGLRQIENTNNTDGVPWIHKVPVIGWAFKSKFTSTGKLELVLFVTPHIIKEEPAITPVEVKQYEMIDYNWRSDEYYDKVDLDNKPMGELIKPREYDGVGFNK